MNETEESAANCAEACVELNAFTLGLTEGIVDILDADRLASLALSLDARELRKLRRLIASKPARASREWVEAVIRGWCAFLVGGKGDSVLPSRSSGSSGTPGDRRPADFMLVESVLASWRATSTLRNLVLFAHWYHAGEGLANFHVFRPPHGSPTLYSASAADFAAAGLKMPEDVGRLFKIEPERMPLAMLGLGLSEEDLCSFALRAFESRVGLELAAVDAKRALEKADREKAKRAPRRAVEYTVGERVDAPAPAVEKPRVGKPKARKKTREELLAELEEIGGSIRGYETGGMTRGRR